MLIDPLLQAMIEKRLEQAHDLSMSDDPDTAQFGRMSKLLTEPMILSFLKEATGSDINVQTSVIHYLGVVMPLIGFAAGMFAKEGSEVEALTEAKKMMDDIWELNVMGPLDKELTEEEEKLFAEVEEAAGITEDDTEYTEADLEVMDSVGISERGELAAEGEDDGN